MTLPQQSGQPQSQHFLLKWNNHRSNMVNVFENLFQSENLVDVTIAVEGKFLKAHKIVLSACSPYFQAMFVNHTPSEKYPILVFHDMKFAHLKTLLDFMYRGEISIDEKDLGEVLKVAEALSIRGLSSFESDDEESEKSEPCQSQAQNQTSQNNNNNNSNNSSSGSTSTSSNSTSGSNLENHGNPNDASTSCTNASAPTTTAPSTTTTTTKGGKHSASHFSKANGKGSPSGHGKYSLASGASANDNHNHPANSSLPHNNGCDSGASPNCGASEKAGGGNIKASKFLHSDRPNPHQNQTKDSNSTAELNPLGGPPLPVKKKRGRQPKNKNLAAVVEPPRPLPTLKPASASKLQARFQELKAPVPRQGVRRRLPRRFPGVPTRLKRVKLAKRDDDDDLFVTGAEGILTDLADGADCEPLSEMSVRGLDLFKYASIEDGVYRCIECEKLRIPKTFKNKYSFQRHAFLYHEGNMRKVFPCPVCSREFSRPDKMKNHLRSIHEGRPSQASNHSGDDNSPENPVVPKAEGMDSCDV